MSDELSHADHCSRSAVCKNGIIVALLILLAIATTGCVVTATREPPAPEPEPVEVLVASEDLPVGTVFTRDELKSAVKLKKLPKNVIRPAYITNAEELLYKRLTRPVRAEEAFNPHDLSKGTGFVLPAGYDVVSILDPPVARADGFIGPGSRINVRFWMREDGTFKQFPLLVNVRVLAVNPNLFTDEQGRPWSFALVLLAVTQKQALALALAKERGCGLWLVPRRPNQSIEADKAYDIDKVIKFFNDLPEIAPPPRPVKE
jgi:Flp pilus assembly protein CpaB